MSRNTSSGIRGILFDFDGTLARTMEDNLAAWIHAIGRPIVPREYFLLEGMSVHKIAEHFCAKFNLPLSLVPEIARKKDMYYLAHHSLEFYPGVMELLGLLSEKGIKCGIVTAAQHARLVGSVPKEFLKHFDALVTAEQSTRGKPFPDPYLKGLELLGLGADECIVVENAPLGIKAAKAAGMRCVAIASTLPKECLMEADEVLGTFKELGKSRIVGPLL